MASHHEGINPHAASDLLRQVMHQKYVTIPYGYLLSLSSLLAIWHSSQLLAWPPLNSYSLPCCRGGAFYHKWTIVKMDGY